MRYAPLLAALMAISCRGDASSSVGTDASVSLTPPRPRSAVPASTTPTDTLSPTAAGWLWLMAIDETGKCVDGAVIEIVGGQGAGLARTQSANCDAWSYDGGWMLFGLAPGSPMKIRASAIEYLAMEKTVVPGTGAIQATQFVLVR